MWICSKTMKKQGERSEVCKQIQTVEVLFQQFSSFRSLLCGENFLACRGVGVELNIINYKKGYITSDISFSSLFKIILYM